MVMMSATAAADPDHVIPKFTALQVKWDSGLDIDWDFFKFQADHIQVNANVGGAWRGAPQLAKPYVDFESSFGATGLAIPAGDGTINLAFDRAVLGVSIGHALLNVGDFFQIEGSFAFEKSTGVLVDVATALPAVATPSTSAFISQLRTSGYLSADNAMLENLPMDVVSFGASDVHIVIGDTSDPLFTLDDIDIGFAIFRASTSLSFAAQIPRLYAMKAHWANPLDVDWGFMQLQLQDLDVKVNQGANWAGLQIAPHIDFVSSFGDEGYQVATGGDAIGLDFQRSTIGVEVAHALIRIDDFIYIEGGFSLEKSKSVALDIKTGFGATPTAQSIAALSPLGTAVNPLDHSKLTAYSMNAVLLGLSDVKLFIGSGPYFRDGQEPDPDAVGLVIDDLDLGLALFNDPLNKVPRLWALEATSDFVGFVGLNFLTLQASGVEVHANSGTAWSGSTVRPYVDFVSSFGDDGLSIATGGLPVALAFTSGVIGASVSDATLQIDEFVYVHGAFAFEKGERHQVSVDTGVTLTSAPGLAGTMAALTASGVEVASDWSRLSNLQVETFTLGMRDVDLFIGYGVPDFNSDTPIGDQDGVFGIVLDDVDLGLAVMTPTLRTVKLPRFTALSATAHQFLVAGGGDDFQLEGNDIVVNVNWSSGWTGVANATPVVDFVDSFGAGGLQVATGGDPVALAFTEGVIEARVTDAVLAVSQFVYLTGDFAFRRGASTELTVNGPLNTQFKNVRASSVEFGGNDVEAFVGVGGPYRRKDANGDWVVNPDAVGLTVQDFDFGLAIFQPVFDPTNPLIPQGTKFTALKAHGEGIGFVGFSDVIELSLEDITVGINHSSQAGLSVDFTDAAHPDGYAVETGGAPVLLDFDNEIIEASVGHATAKIAGLVELEGGFAFQRRYLPSVSYNLLGFEASMPGEALVVVGRDVNAFAGIHIGDHKVGLEIDNLDFALAMVTPAVAPGINADGIRFFTLEATADFAGLVGTDPFLTLEAHDIVLELNAGMVNGYPLPIYVDWSQQPDGGLTIPVGTAGLSYTFDQSEAMLRVGMQADIGVFDMFTLSLPAFDFTFVMPELPGLPDLSLSLPPLPDPGLPSLPDLDLPDFDVSSFLPRLSLQSLGELPDIDFPGLDFLQGAIDFAKNLDISIGFDASFNLSLLGSIELPDLTLDLGDFVYLNGDFKLSFGQSFTGTMYTGLPKELALVEDLLGSTGQTILDGLKAVVGVSGDYSRIENVRFSGMTFGAADVNVFVGTGGPDFSRPLSQQDDLFGFGMQNLDIALSVFQAQGDLAELINAEKFYSLKAHADELGTYGMGDILKLRAQDITIELNSGGKALGGVMRATADYADSFPAEEAGDPVGLKVETGGDPVYLDFTGNELLGIDIGMADIAVADFLYLRGSLAFRKGEVYDVQVNLGGLQPLVDSLNEGAGINLPSPLPMQVTALTLAGANLSGFAGVGGPYRYGEDADGDGYLDQINQGAVGLVLDHVDFGLAIMTPTLATAIPGMEQYAPKFVTAKASIGTAGLVGVDPDLLSVEAHDVEVNINTFVVPSLGAVGNGILQLFGPPSIDYQASFADSPEDKNDNGILDEGEDLDGDGELDAYGLALPAGGDNAVIVDFDEEIVQAKVGYAQINLAGFVQLSASMAFTKKGSEQVTLSDGTQTTVTSLAIGINDAYGFVGVGGYWQDSNGDGRINEDDTPDTSAVGLAIEDLDLGIIVAKELVISAEGVDVGVYLAAKASVTSVGLVGLGDDVVMRAEDLDLEINTGVRFSLGVGQFTSDASGAVSYDSNLSVSASLTTIDFSKSTWVKPSAPDVQQAGYAIPTGNPEEPVVLDYSGQFLRIAGEVELDLFGLVHLDGVVDFTADEDTGITAFADADVRIGTGGFEIASHATGLLAIRDGVALRMVLDAGIDLGSFASLDAHLDLTLNTLGEEVVYEVPAEFRDAVDFDTFTIPATPPGKPDWTGMYVALVGNGHLSLLNDALDLKGDFSIIVSESGMELGATAVLDLPVFEPLAVTGTLGIVSGGLYGSLQVGSPSDSGGSLLIQAGAFEVRGGFLLQINTTSVAQQVRSLKLDADGQPTGETELVSLASHSLRMAGSAAIAVGPVELVGSMDISISDLGLEAEIGMILDLDVLGSVRVEGAVAIIDSPTEGPVFALRATTSVSLGVGALGISAGATLEINTSQEQEYAGVDPGTTFFLGLEGQIHILAFDVDFKGSMSVIDDVFELRIDHAGLDFFGVFDVDVSGYIRSDGHFSITGSAHLGIDMGPLELNAGMSVTLSDTRFAATVYGSLDIHIDLGLSRSTRRWRLQRHDRAHAGSAYLSARVTIVGISVSGSYSGAGATRPSSRTRSATRCTCTWATRRAATAAATCTTTRCTSPTRSTAKAT